MARAGRVQRWFEKHLVNPFMGFLLRRGVAPRAFGLIETTGRVTGCLRQTPIGLRLDEDGPTAWLVAEHGTGCDYVRNLVAEPTVRIKVRRRWYQGRAVVIEGDDALARRRAIDVYNGVVGRLDGVIFRAAASTPCTVRIDLDR